MAGGTITLANSSQTSGGGYLMGKIDWSATADVSSNTSQVTVWLYVKKASTMGTITTPTTGHWDTRLTINGEEIRQNINISISADWVLMIAKAVTISHNSDGKKSIAISASCRGPSGTSYAGKSTEGSGTATLDTIPRASKIGASDANIGSTSAVIISRASSSFTHTITYSFQGLTGTIASKTSATSIAWPVPTSFYAEIPNSKTGICTLTCTTYSGTTAIGTSRCTLMVIASQALCEPTVSGTIIDVNAATIALTGSSSKLIKYKSTARCTISAASKNSASISSKSINGLTPTNNTRDFPSVSTNSFAFKATDSRGYAKSVTKSTEMIPYVQLTCNPIISRPMPTGSTLVMTFSGDYFSGSFGQYSNTLTIRYRYKEAGTDAYGDWIAVSPTNYTIGPTSYKTNAEITIGTNFDYQTAYVFEIQAYDGADGTILSSVTRAVSVTKGIPVYSWGEHDFTVHKNLTVDGEINGYQIQDLDKKLGRGVWRAVDAGNGAIAAGESVSLTLPANSCFLVFIWSHASGPVFSVHIASTYGGANNKAMSIIGSDYSTVKTSEQTLTMTGTSFDWNYTVVQL